MGIRIYLSMEQREATERFMRQVEDAGLRTGKRPKVPNHLCVELSALDDQKFRSSRISPCLFMAVIHRHPFAHQATKESTSTDAQSTRKRSCKKKKYQKLFTMPLSSHTTLLNSHEACSKYTTLISTSRSLCFEHTNTVTFSIAPSKRAFLSLENLCPMTFDHACWHMLLQTVSITRNST